MRSLTAKQAAILNFIEEFQENTSMPPTVQEIAEEFSVKSSTVFAHLRALQRKNLLARSSKARSICINKQHNALANEQGIWTVPLLGKVCAGNPAECTENFEGEVIIPAGIAGLTDCSGIFALCISGESMRDLGIYEGDIVIIAPQTLSRARSGDIVVALVQGGEVTVKSYFPQRNGDIELRPANANYRSQLFHYNEVQIQGKVISLQRNY